MYHTLVSQGNDKITIKCKLVLDTKQRLDLLFVMFEGDTEMTKVNKKHKQIVEESGAEYVPGMFGNLVLFNSYQTKSTLALSEDQLSVEAVRAHVAESNAKFKKVA